MQQQSVMIFVMQCRVKTPVDFVVTKHADYKLVNPGTLGDFEIGSSRGLLIVHTLANEAVLRLVFDD